MTEEQPPKGFNKYFNQAKDVVNDAQKTSDLLDSARSKAKKQSGKIGQIKTDLETLMRLIGAWIKGEYKKVPLQTILMALAGIIYFLNPFDLVHDWLPGLGFTDDAALLIFVMKNIKKDLDEFKIWEKHS